MRRGFVAVAFTLLFAITMIGPADAQWTSSLGGNFNNPGSALLGTMIANRALADAARKATAPEPSGAPTRPTTTRRTTFRPVAKSLMVNELAHTLAPNGASQQTLATAFEEYLRSFDQQAQSDSEPSNDVGRAAAYFVMLNYLAATGREPTDAQTDGAQATFRSGLAASSDFARMSDRDRQRLYEALVILGSLPLAGVVDSEKSKDKVRAAMFREFAGELIKAVLGAPVEKIHLTRTGFTIGEDPH
jgi:hypothetical protein